MATVLCTVNTLKVTSSDITAVAGTPVSLFLSSNVDEQIPGDALALIEQKSNAGKWTVLGKMTVNNLAAVIDAPGTYRVVKNESTVAYGVEQG